MPRKPASPAARRPPGRSRPSRAPARRRSVARALEPSARKTGAPESPDDVRILAECPPYELRPVILDHGDDGALVDPELIAVEPADPGYDPSVLDGDARVGQRRIERVHESVAVEVPLPP